MPRRRHGRLRHQAGAERRRSTRCSRSGSTTRRSAPTPIAPDARRRNRFTARSGAARDACASSTAATVSSSPRWSRSSSTTRPASSAPCRPRSSKGDSARRRARGPQPEGRERQPRRDDARRPLRRARSPRPRVGARHGARPARLDPGRARPRVLRPRRRLRGDLTMRVLVADDEPTSRLLLRRAIERLSPRVRGRGRRPRRVGDAAGRRLRRADHRLDDARPRRPRALPPGARVEARQLHVHPARHLAERATPTSSRGWRPAPTTTSSSRSIRSRCRPGSSPRNA